MRRVTLAAALAVVFVAASSGCRGGDESASPTVTTTQFAEQSQAVSDVEVKVRPTALDTSGATFTVTLDTHSAELDTDLTSATLDVGGTRWPSASWNGDTPGGHHRTGTLRFASAGPATGVATLTIVGLAAPAVFSWNIGVP